MAQITNHNKLAIIVQYLPVFQFYYTPRLAGCKSICYYRVTIREKRQETQTKKNPIKSGFCPILRDVKIAVSYHL